MESMEYFCKSGSISSSNQRNSMVLNFLGILQECTSGKESAIIKVIIDKSRGEVSLLEQDTIENVS